MSITTATSFSSAKLSPSTNSKAMNGGAIITGGGNGYSTSPINTMDGESIMPVVFGSDSLNTRVEKSSGRLRVTIVSANDMIDREPPLYVQLDLIDAYRNNNHNNSRTVIKSLRTGPPVQQHKDKNSFRFHPNQSSSRSIASGSAGGTAGGGSSSNIQTSRGKLIVDTLTLAELYQQSLAVFTVVYANPAKPQFATAPFPLHQLLIHQPKWLILNLSSSSTSQTPAGSFPALTTIQDKREEDDDDDDSEVLPTLRLQMTLEGPYRPEVAALIQLTQGWYSLVDSVQSKFAQVLGPYVPQKIPIQWILIPTVPMVAAAVVSSPVVAGIFLLTFPIALPMLTIAMIMGAAVCAFGTFIYASTKTGRDQVATMLRPIQQTMIQTPTGQRWIYQTGPRPTPVHLLRATVTPTGIWGKLLFSFWLDFLGSSSYLLPLVGEVMDLFWAPTQTALIMAMYCPDDHDCFSTPRKTSSSSFGSAVLPYLSFTEEILPFTDIVPTATIGWFGEFALPMIFGLFSSSNAHDDSMDTAALLPINGQG
ncbi:hypothetical protein ACA910_020262 [Epithemia clementina (nom. ined.)]